MEMLLCEAKKRMYIKKDHEARLCNNKISTLNNKIDMWYKVNKKSKDKKKHRKELSEYHDKIKKYKDELNIINKVEINVSEDDIIEDDWLNLIQYHESLYFKCLDKKYKEKFERIKHMRTKKFLLLLKKLRDDYNEIENYFNRQYEFRNHDELSAPLFGKITDSDFKIDNLLD